jgi:cAMP-dependent protein kinase regulator
MGGPLDHVREEEEEDAPMESATTNMPGSFAAFSFSGSPSAGSPPEGSPFDEHVPTTTNKFPPPAASAGKATASADDLVVPSYALGRRTSVSAESLVPSAALAAGASSRLAAIHDEDMTPTLGSSASLAPKSQEQLDRIKQSISNNFLFRNLDEEQERDVLAAMREVAVAPGHVVIEQGAAGDFFYVVEDGEFDIYVKKGDAAQAEEESKWGKNVHTAVPGGSFGELALMYK